MKKEYVVLVDKDDNEIGIEEKMAAHLNGGKLHRAFSIFVFNSAGELLIHRRALSKYHCPGLWTNTCCSHPRHGEALVNAIHRRLFEEMGFDCELGKLGTFLYRAEFDNGLTEHEFDHSFRGEYNGHVDNFDKREVCDIKWIGLKKLKTDILENGEKYTPWFKIAVERFF